MADKEEVNYVEILENFKLSNVCNTSKKHPIFIQTQRTALNLPCIISYRPRKGLEYDW